MTAAERFISEIDAFLERSGMSATAFGKGAVSDPSFVHEIRDGRKPNLGLVDRVHDFMRAHEAGQSQNNSDDEHDAHADEGSSADSVQPHKASEGAL